MGNRVISACQRAILLTSLVVASALPRSAPAAEPIAFPDPTQPVNIMLLDGPGLPPPASALYVDVFLNQVALRYVVQVFERDDRIFIWPEHFAALGLKPVTIPDTRYIALEDIPGLTYRLDRSRQRLTLMAQTERLNIKRQRYNMPERASPAASADAGALVNYDMRADFNEGGNHGLTAATGVRAFRPLGVLESTGLSQLRTVGESDAYTRLDTSLRVDGQGSLRTLEFGDLISGSLAWTRATRIGGIQLRRNFGLQPELVTEPVPAFFGEAALPSRLELYVDGLRQYSDSILPGPYEIEVPPLVNGAGSAEVVLTDALGRVRVFDFNYYSAPQLLDTGLSDYSFALGALRRSFGTASFDYGDTLVASASGRYGWSRWLTLEGHAQGAEDLAVAGGGVLTLLGQLGTLSGSWVASAGREDYRGHQASVGYRWARQGFSIDYRIDRRFDRYTDIAALEGRPPPRHAERLGIAAGLRNSGTVSVNYARLETAAATSSRTISIGASTRLQPGWTVFANLTRDLGSESRWSAFISLSIAFNRRLSATANAVRDRDDGMRYGAGLRRILPPDGGTGWSVDAQRDPRVDTYQAQIRHIADRFTAGSGIRSIDNRVSGFADAGGAFVWMAKRPGHLFPARQVRESFALVSTNGIADIPVLLENRMIGATDDNGYFLLTGLGPYRENRIAIDALGLPADLQFATRRTTVTPRIRSGVVTDFGIRRTTAALLVIHDTDQQPLPVGSRVLRDAAFLTTIGHDGQAYVEQLGLGGFFTAQLPDGSSCAFSVAPPKQVSALPTLGPITCH